MRYSQTKVQQRLLGLDKQIMYQTIGNCLELKRNSHMKKRQGDLNILLSKQCQFEKSMHHTILTI